VDAVTNTYRCQHIGGPYDGQVEDRVFETGQEEFIWAQAVKVRPDTEDKPWLLHRFEVELDGKRALLKYRGYKTSDTRPYLAK